METSLPSRLAELKETVQLLSLSMAAQRAVCDVLEEMSVRIYSLEEDRRMLKENLRDTTAKVRSLEHRYSELMYRLSSR